MALFGYNQNMYLAIVCNPESPPYLTFFFQMSFVTFEEKLDTFLKLVQ